MKKRSLLELNRLTVPAFKNTEKTPLVVLLDNVRSALNVGSAFRTAVAFLVLELALCGITAQPPHREILKTAIGASKSVDWRYFETTQAAIQHYNQALSLNPNSGDTYFNRAVTHSILRNHAAAIADYTQVLQLLPQQAAQAYRYRGIALYELRRFQEAKADFQRVLQFNPNDQQAKQYLNRIGG